MADTHAFVDEDGNVRTGNGVGEAYAPSTSSTGKMDISGPTNWSQLAYSAGGGLLAYWLAKQLLGDDKKKGKDGKEEKPGILKSLIPYLAAAGGAMGGYSLASMPSGGGKGRKGEVALPLNDDGTVKSPELHGKKTDLAIGGTAAGASLAGYTGARSYHNYRLNLADRFTDRAFRLTTNANRLPDGPRKTELLNLADSYDRLSARIAERYNGPGVMPRFRKFLGRNPGTGLSRIRMRSGGNALAALASLIAAGYSGVKAYNYSGEDAKLRENLGKAGLM